MPAAKPKNGYWSRTVPTAYVAKGTGYVPETPDKKEKPQLPPAYGVMASDGRIFYRQWKNTPAQLKKWTGVLHSKNEAEILLGEALIAFPDDGCFVFRFESGADGQYVVPDCAKKSEPASNQGAIA